MAIFSVIVTTGGMSFKTGMEYAAANFAILETEVDDARGACASIAARLGVTLNQDGTQIVASATGVDWSTTGYTAAQVDADTFEVTDPATSLVAILSPGRVVRFNNDGTAIYATIKASSFAAAKTTVDIFGTNVPAAITQLDIGIVHFGDAGSVISVEPISTKPAYAAKYAGRLLYAVDTGKLWFGNALGSAFKEVSPGIVWSTITGATDAVVQNGYVCNTTAGAFTLTLPASPVVGDEIAITDGAGTFDTENLTIGRNSLKIMGLSEDMTVSTKYAAFSLVYASAALGWRIA